MFFVVKDSFRKESEPRESSASVKIFSLAEPGDYVSKNVSHMQSGYSSRTDYHILRETI